MAYRFKLKEPVQNGLRRIGLEQIAEAEAKLGAARNRAVAIHETRKCLKRIRALLRLVRPGLGEDVFRRENERFRDIGRLLSQARDREILPETLAKLESNLHGRRIAGLETLRSILREEEARKCPATSRASTDQALRLLSGATRAFERLRITPDSFSVVEKGLKKSYAGARKRGTAAYASANDETFHNWRKSVQQHWRHMQLLSRAWPEHFSVRVESARRLSQIIGDDHDLAILAKFVRALPHDRMSEHEVRAILSIISVRQTELRKEARPLGLRLFAEKPGDHAERTAKLWAAARLMTQLDKEPGTATNGRGTKASKTSHNSQIVDNKPARAKKVRRPAQVPGE